MKTKLTVKNKNDLKDYPSAMTVSEVATVLRLCTKTVYKLIKEGEIPAKRIGSEYRIPKKSIYIYLNRI